MSYFFGFLKIKHYICGRNNNQCMTMKIINKNMLGAIVGDIVGSVYEFNNIKTTEFELFTGGSRFTDDTVMTLAVAWWLTTDETHSPDRLVECMQGLGRRYPYAGYGGNFARWIFRDRPAPYGSWGNGSGMRVSPVGLYAATLDEALALAEISASVTHDHPEGIKGAQAVAACMYMCRAGNTKEEVKSYIEKTFGYDLSRTLDDIRSGYTYDVSCQGSVPEAIIAFLEGRSFEETIRLAVSIGGDSDTIACMTGAIASCLYPIPMDIAGKCDDVLTDDLRDIKDEFLSMVSARNGLMDRFMRMFH